MTFPVAFMLTGAPDHPEVRDLLTTLNQVLPNADGDALEQVRRVHACVMLVISGRLEGRLLDALDDDRKPLPAAALFREIVRLRKEAIALLESLLLDATAPGRPSADDTAEVLDPASEMMSSGARCIPKDQEIMSPVENRLTGASSDIAQRPDDEAGMPGQVTGVEAPARELPVSHTKGMPSSPGKPGCAGNIPSGSFNGPSVQGARDAAFPGSRISDRHAHARLGNKPREGPMRGR
ncbi:MAG TPA: hypothetical protein PK379_08070 [Candidatus Hydrogenedentes bacterium]|nr:hypothetical protein [Candidatus Hydrogenedentota bacterium]